LSKQLAGKDGFSGVQVRIEQRWTHEILRAGTVIPDMCVSSCVGFQSGHSLPPTKEVPPCMGCAYPGVVRKCTVYRSTASVERETKNVRGSSGSKENGTGVVLPEEGSRTEVSSVQGSRLHHGIGFVGVGREGPPAECGPRYLRPTGPSV
jgi:hypothetical protein